jgi:ubiquinone biosynthesis protein
MNAVGFIGLLRSIYGKGLPDLDKIQDRGLLAVKIAQHYALRIDFLDEEVCRHLAKLYRQTRPLPAEDVDTLLRSNVDRSWFERVRHLAPTPFASASIGQIHRAELDDGTQVIVKLVKRDFTKSFLKDVRSLRRLLRVALTIYPKLRKVFDPMGILDHIEDYTTAELNLCNEVAGADTLESIRDDYKDRYDLSRMRLPQFYRDLSNEKVLVARLIRGKTFDELLDEGALSYEKLLELFGIHGFYLFGRGVFHGDIHPGNIIVDPDGNLNFVDTGALSRSGERIRRGLFWFFEALSRYDYPECAKRLNDMAEKPIDGTRFDRFRGRFDELYRDFADRTVSEVSLTKKMMDTIKLGVNNGMEFGKGMFPVIKSLMYLDGMVLRCKPDAILLRDMRPFIDGFEKVL